MKCLIGNPVEFFFSPLLNGKWDILTRLGITKGKFCLLNPNDMWNAHPLCFVSHSHMTVIFRVEFRACLLNLKISLNQQLTGSTFSMGFNDHESEWPVSWPPILLLLQMCLINTNWEWYYLVNILMQFFKMGFQVICLETIFLHSLHLGVVFCCSVLLNRMAETFSSGLHSKAEIHLQRSLLKLCVILHA